MNILVVGCGKVGINLCERLLDMGHDISVIGENEEEFSALPENFSGFTTAGVAIDQDVLRRAGIESCDAVAAVNSSDNINLMVLQLAKEIFHVKIGIARVNDPKKSEVFNKMGIQTICPTTLTVETLAASLSKKQVSANVSVGSHSIVLSVSELEDQMIGCRISELTFDKNEMLFAVEHEDNRVSGVMLKNYTFVKGDKIITARFAD